MTMPRPGRDQAALDRARGRARAIRDAAEQRPPGEVYAYRCRNGAEVHLARITYHEDGDAAWVEAWAAGAAVGTDPHFRIYNPPTLVPDPAGPVTRDGRRFRNDPLAAVAEVVASLGGARSGSKHR